MKKFNEGSTHFVRAIPRMERQAHMSQSLGETFVLKSHCTCRYTRKGDTLMLKRKQKLTMTRQNILSFERSFEQESPLPSRERVRGAAANLRHPHLIPLPSRERKLYIIA